MFILQIILLTIPFLFWCISFLPFRQLTSDSILETFFVTAQAGGSTHPGAGPPPGQLASHLGHLRPHLGPQLGPQLSAPQEQAGAGSVEGFATRTGNCASNLVTVFYQVLPCSSSQRLVCSCHRDSG